MELLRLRVVHVVGARPNLMKAAAVIKHRPDDLVIHTGQHWDLGTLDGFRPDINLDCRTSNLPDLLQALTGEFQQTNPGKVVVYGDVNSTLAAALAAAHLNIPVAHVEAGLRSGDMSMPEEVNRLAVDAVSTEWFTTEPEAVANLAGKGQFVGNPMIDTLKAAGVERSSGGPVIVTLHRPGNVDNPERAGRIVAAINEIAVEFSTLVVRHPRAAHLQFKCDTVDALPYREFIEMVAAAPFVVTDSGGVQEETTWLDVPCFTLRPNTERPVTVTLGSNRLVEPEDLPAAVARDWPTRRAMPPLWDGHAGERIAACL